MHCHVPYACHTSKQAEAAEKEGRVGGGECGTFGDSFCEEETNHPFAHALSEIKKLHQHMDLCVLFIHVAEIDGMASVPSPGHAQQYQPMDSSLC